MMHCPLCVDHWYSSCCTLCCDTCCDSPPDVEVCCGAVLLGDCWGCDGGDDGGGGSGDGGADMAGAGAGVGVGAGAGVGISAGGCDCVGWSLSCPRYANCILSTAGFALVLMKSPVQLGPKPWGREGEPGGLRNAVLGAALVLGGLLSSCLASRAHVEYSGTEVWRVPACMHAWVCMYVCIQGIIALLLTLQQPVDFVWMDRNKNVVATSLCSSYLGHSSIV